jgi:hypothetical protein
MVDSDGRLRYLEEGFVIEVPENPAECHWSYALRRDAAHGAKPPAETMAAIILRVRSLLTIISTGDTPSGPRGPVLACTCS